MFAHRDNLVSVSLTPRLLAIVDDATFEGCPALGLIEVRHGYIRGRWWDGKRPMGLYRTISTMGWGDAAFVMAGPDRHIIINRPHYDHMNTRVGGSANFGQLSHNAVLTLFNLLYNLKAIQDLSLMSIQQKLLDLVPLEEIAVIICPASLSPLTADPTPGVLRLKKRTLSVLGVEIAVHLTVRELGCVAATSHEGISRETTDSNGPFAFFDARGADTEENTSAPPCPTRP